MRDTWAKHPAICALWSNKDYAEGVLDWDPGTLKLTENWADQMFDDMSTTVTKRAKAKCICDPEKKWLCSTCGVRRMETWHEWEWDSSLSTWDKSTTKTTWVTKDRQCMTELIFPNGTTVYGSSMNRSGEVKPDFGVYLASGWLPECLGFTINWQDFGLPKIGWDQVIHAAKEAINLAEQGWKVEVGCVGGHGRTGTFLAYLAVLSGVPASDAVAYVRTNYCEHAVETKEQEFSVIQFDAMINDQPVPPYIKEPFELKNSKGTKSVTIYQGRFHNA